VQQSRRRYTLDDYLSLQRGVEIKLEYLGIELPLARVYDRVELM